MMAFLVPKSPETRCRRHGYDLEPFHGLKNVEEHPQSKLFRIPRAENQNAISREQHGEMCAREAAVEGSLFPPYTVLSSLVRLANLQRSDKDAFMSWKKS
ncbi:hypothetical protein HPP92_014063 [Vanilla planifolia]|uniref:Uncharacterized protein n=1 Tax=Vanilla planifolia TaxID=51239 RepID=A0A835R0L0_VANPL|nr:hypothetical protein HPP92_014063 [Vanilla planifolia]